MNKELTSSINDRLSIPDTNQIDLWLNLAELAPIETDRIDTGI